MVSFDFNSFPTNIKHLLFYISATCSTCHPHTICQTIAQQIKDRYKYSISFDLGITGRNELVHHPARKISDTDKAIIKHNYVQKVINKHKVSHNSVYFYDDCVDITDNVRKLGVNSVNVMGLHPEDIKKLLSKKENNFTSVNILLLDFDKTISITRFKKKYLQYSTPSLVSRYFGGYNRLDALKTQLHKLEILGVKIGIVSFHTQDVVIEIFKRIGWLPE